MNWGNSWHIDQLRHTDRLTGSEADRQGDRRSVGLNELVWRTSKCQADWESDIYNYYLAERLTISCWVRVSDRMWQSLAGSKTCQIYWLTENLKDRMANWKSNRLINLTQSRTDKLIGWDMEGTNWRVIYRMIQCYRLSGECLTGWQTHYLLNDSLSDWLHYSQTCTFTPWLTVGHNMTQRRSWV
jgi:hypothetical protein